MNDFGHRFRHAMKLRGLTSQQLAGLSGYPYETVRHWRKGIRFPRLQACRDIAQALQVRAGWLAFGEGEME